MSSVLQESLNQSFKGVSKLLNEFLFVLQFCFARISSQLPEQKEGLFKENVKCCSRKFQVKFEECFNVVLFCNFVVARISSQLPEQKEGLFVCTQIAWATFWLLPPQSDSIFD